MVPPGGVRDLYRSRFRASDQAARQELWNVLVDVLLGKWIPRDATVVDLGAGRCEFLHAIACRRKIAVDLNPDVGEHAGPDVEVLATASSDLHALEDGSVDVVFASNFFEHLPGPGELLATLGEARRVLAPAGVLLVLQPNVRLVGGAFWDFLDHTLPLTERSLREAVETSGLRIVELRTRCLPYTTVGRRLPPAWLLRLYLRLPPAQWALGKQTFMVAERPSGA
ncbi:MAG TPA: class I SAM-dependent methyltransferase [Gaiellaceae bacterium]|nr:class I SAM-dependent methyltransferase [Gaiellaceae bacterium]